MSVFDRALRAAGLVTGGRPVIDEATIRSWVHARCDLWRHDSPRGVPRAPTQADLEAFAWAFLPEAAPVREGIVTRHPHQPPSAEQLAAIQRLWTEWRVATYGPAALQPRPRYRGPRTAEGMPVGKAVARALGLLDD